MKDTLLTAVLAAIGGGLIVLAVGQLPSDKVVAHGFALVDKEGRTRAELRMTKAGGAELLLRDDKGKVRAEVEAMAYTGDPSLTLWDARGHFISGLTAGTDGKNPILHLNYCDGSAALGLIVVNNEYPQIVLIGRDGLEKTIDLPKRVKKK